jgi:hypothetical protein
MKKRDLPKPKYGLGVMVVYQVAGEGNTAPHRDAARVQEITMKITPAGYSIRYSFDNGNDVDESAIIRRVVL